MVELKQASIADLPRMEECATAFYASSQHLKDFTLEKFVEFWAELINAGMGVIFTLEIEGRIVGVLGGIRHRDLYSSAYVAGELFWYVLKEARGAGGRLMAAFEEWAIKSGCTMLKMGALADSMPERLDKVYSRWGFVRTEVHYTKELPCAT